MTAAALRNPILDLSVGTPEAAVVHEAAAKLPGSSALAVDATIWTRGAQATARCRARQKQCRAQYRADADGAVLTMLINRHYLDEAEVDDAREVGKAITVFLSDHAEMDD